MSAPHELFRLVRLVGAHERSGGIVYVFVCYLDDSDHVQSSVITLAGYAGSLEAWEQYEETAARIYARYEIGNILHAKEFHDTKGAFRGWSRAKKNRFVDELYQSTPLTWGVGVSIGKEGFRAKKSHPAIGPNLSPLGLAFGVIMHTLIRGNPLSGLIQLKGISFVVESGHRNNGDLERYFHFAKNHEVFKGYARSISFADKTSSRALHLADFLAFHLRRHHALVHRHRSVIVPKGDMLSRICNKLPHLLKIGTGEQITPIPNPTEADSKWWSLPVSLRPTDR